MLAKRFVLRPVKKDPHASINEIKGKAASKNVLNLFLCRLFVIVIFTSVTSPHDVR